MCCAHKSIPSTNSNNHAISEQTLPMFVLSKAASISSRTKKGAGL